MNVTPLFHAKRNHTGVPEPVISHLGALQDDVRRMAQFLGMTPAVAAAPALPGAAPAGVAPVAGAEAGAAPVSWGSAPPARAAPKIQNIGGCRVAGYVPVAMRAAHDAMLPNAIHHC